MVFLMFVMASSLQRDAWSPNDSVLALDSVIRAVKHVTELPHLSPERARQSVQVVQSVSRDIEDVERGTLTKTQARGKVGAAIKTLEMFEKQSTVTAMAAQPNSSRLQENVIENQTQLNDSRTSVKLLNIEHVLVEKKKILQALISQKAVVDHKGRLSPEELAMRESRANRLDALSKQLQGDSRVSEQEMKRTLVWLDAEQQNVSSSLNDLEVAKAITTNQFDIVAKLESTPETPDTNQSSNATAATQGRNSSNQTSTSYNRTNQTSSPRSVISAVMDMFKKTARRNYQKLVDFKKLELKELQDAEASIKKRDVRGLQRVVSNMRAETKLLRTKSGTFIY